MNTPIRKTARLFLAIGAIGSLHAAAHAEQVTTAAELEAFLSDSFILEDFEGVNLHGGGVWPTVNPLNDGTISSFFTIEPGVTYTSTGAMSFFGGFLGGEDSVFLRGENDLTMTFDEIQAGVGMLVLSAPGSTVVTFYNGVDELGVLTPTTSAFSGWTDTTVGITSVAITSTISGLVVIDDMMFGAVFDPTCPSDLNFDGSTDAADLGLLLGDFGTTNPTSDINGDGVVDAADLGILLAAWDTSCN